MDAHVKYASLFKQTADGQDTPKAIEIKEIFNNLLSDKVDYSYIFDFSKLLFLWSYQPGDREAIEGQMVKVLAQVTKYKTLIDYLAQCPSQKEPEVLVEARIINVLSGFYFEDLFELWINFEKVAKSRHLISARTMELLTKITKEKTDVVLLHDFLRVMKINVIPPVLLPFFKEKVSQLMKVEEKKNNPIFEPR